MHARSRVHARRRRRRHRPRRSRRRSRPPNWTFSLNHWSTPRLTSTPNTRAISTAGTTPPARTGSRTAGAAARRHPSRRRDQAQDPPRRRSRPARRSGSDWRSRMTQDRLAGDRPRAARRCRAGRHGHQPDGRDRDQDREGVGDAGRRCARRSSDQPANQRTAPRRSAAGSDLRRRCGVSVMPLQLRPPVAKYQQRELPKCVTGPPQGR